MSVLEAFPGHLSKPARDVSDELLRPEDRFTAAERERPRMSWLNQSAQSAARDRAPGPGDAAGPTSPEWAGRRPTRKQDRAGSAHPPSRRQSRGHHTDSAAAEDRSGHGTAGRLANLTVEVVSCYVAANALPAPELSDLIRQVHAALAHLSAPEEERIEKASPAQIRKSITPDALISFIDGKPYKTLKRHLTTHGLDIEGYRRRYGLPSDYPTVSANYSAARSALAKDLGLGQQRRKPSHEAADPTASETPVPAPRKGAGRKTGGRRKAAA